MYRHSTPENYLTPQPGALSFLAGRPGTPEPIAALNRVRLEESGEPLVDLRRHCPGVRVSRKCLPFLRAGVADMLSRAQESLPTGWRLWVRTALRTLDMQREMYDRNFEALRQKHPDWSYAALRRSTNRFFAPYDQPAPPGHCTGAAVDVNLVTPGNRPADMVSPFKGWEAAPTWTTGLSETALRHRAILWEAMVGAGFSNCRDEHWHYSYGDAAWAVRTGHKTCIYGLIEPPDGWPRKR